MLTPVDVDTCKDYAFAEKLVRDELFDLTLYRRLRAFAKGETEEMLKSLIAMEEGRLTFW